MCSIFTLISLNIKLKMGVALESSGVRGRGDSTSGVSIKG